ncbi:MAG: ABC transporter permease [Thermoplasmata archaeon]
MAKQARWSESRRAFRRSLRNGWNIYKKSKIGMAGLILIIMFVVMAVFAPFLTPYTPQFTAPSVDIIRGDIYTQPLPNATSWNNPPVGVINYHSAQGSNQYLQYVMVYNNLGQVKLYPAWYNYTKQKILNVHLKPALNYSIPKGINDLEETGTYVSSFSNPITYYGFTNNTFYIFDSNFNIVYKSVLPFNIQHRSILYNNPSAIPSQGQYIAIVFTNGTHASIYLFYNAEISTMGYFAGYVDKNPMAIINFTTPSDTILSPIIYLNPADSLNGYLNTTTIIMPLENQIVAYTISIKMNTTYYKIYNVSVPQEVSAPKILWSQNYSVMFQGKEQSFTPVGITYGYPWGDEPGVQNIAVVGTSNNMVIGYSRTTGNVVYVNGFTIPNPSYKSYVLTNIVGTKSGNIFAYADMGTRTAVALIDPNKGLIMSDGAFYNVVDGAVNSIPTYDLGSAMYILSTTDGLVYTFNSNMKVNSTFTVLGGLKTPINGLGNVIGYTSLSGYFYGGITKNGDLYMQMTVGTNIAPLPPGKYPSGNTYILGTDVYGHDIWTWIVYGARAELIVGTVAAVTSVFLGTFLGLISGFYGGWVDSILMRLTDIFLSIPGLVIMLLLISILGPNIWNVILVIAILGWSGITRIIRAQVMSLKSRAFIDAARVSGASNFRLMMVHIFPNIIPLTFLFMSFGVSGAILTEASLAFLGMGDPNAITWGMMLQYIFTTGNVLSAPWWLIPPGLAITLLSMAFYLVGRAFDEVVNPRLRRR